MLITSLQNPKVKHALKLRERRQRKRDGLMLIEGYDELRLALASNVRLQTLFFCPAFFGAVEEAALLDPARQTEAEMLEVSRDVFEKMAYRENPDGWLGVAPAANNTLADLSLSANPLLVVAEAVEKPGNLGAILRSADAAGVEAVILCDPTVDIGNPNVIRSSRGTVFSVPVVEVTSAEALAWLGERGIKVVAATPEAASPFTEVDFTGPIAIVVGTEREGLSPIWREQVAVKAHIPMLGKVNSLNVATATTLFIYEVLRQRKFV
ncbi:MAG: RNA methyltransferase [Chloroflexi bacterium]|nr:RNA methyltransferase [Chloroflexota bacterium]